MNTVPPLHSLPFPILHICDTRQLQGTPLPRRKTQKINNLIRSTTKGNCRRGDDGETKHSQRTNCNSTPRPDCVKSSSRVYAFVNPELQNKNKKNPNSRVNVHAGVPCRRPQVFRTDVQDPLCPLTWPASSCSSSRSSPIVPKTELPETSVCPPPARSPRGLPPLSLLQPSGPLSAKASKEWIANGTHAVYTWMAQQEMLRAIRGIGNNERRYPQGITVSRESTWIGGIVGREYQPYICDTFPANVGVGVYIMIVA